jgi:hypothetical protein
MTDRPTSLARRTPRLLALGVAGAALIGASHPAQARVWVGFGFPLVVAPPVYYPPPAYYPPPPVYYPPPPYYAPPPVSYAPPPPQYSPAGQSCIVAGASVCPMEHPVAAGASCYCTTPQGRIWGRST